MFKNIAALPVCLAASMLFSATAQAADVSTPNIGAASETTAAEVQTEEPEETKPETPPVPLSLEDIRTVKFQDLQPEDPHADCILYTAYTGLLSGVTEDRFDPDGLVSLAAALTSLYRMSGETAPAYAGTFSDVPEGKWYTDAAAWAVQRGIVTGRSDGTLHPLEPVTRAQLAALLYRYVSPADVLDYDWRLTAYTDGGSIAEYARLPVAWMLENRLFSGIVIDTIHPQLPVSRAQLAQVLTALTAYNNKEPVAAALAEQMGAGAAASVSRAKHDDIQAMINQTAAKYGAAGLQVAVVEKGRLTDNYTYGYAVKNSVPMSSDHKIRCASITKVAVGMAAMLLREQGLINIDQDISDYWGIQIRNPYYPQNPVTIRSLLSHTSSLRVLDNSNSTYNSVYAKLKSSSAFSKKMPGNIYSWDYNNYGFTVLGMTLELVSWQYLDTIMQNAMWDLMDIDGAFVSGSLKRPDLIANIYRNGKVGMSAYTQANYMSGSTPAAKGVHFSGGMTMSAKDVAKMAALLANDGYYEGLRLMSPESVRLMETRDETMRLSDGGYQALPLRSQDQIYGRDTLYYHTGYSYGTYNLFSYDPIKKDAVVVLTTGASSKTDSRGIFAVCGEISQNIYQILA